MPDRLHTVFLNLAAALAYAVLGLLSTSLTFTPEDFTPVWIPAGVVVSFALIWGARVYPGLLLGTLLFHFGFHSHAFSEPFTLSWIWHHLDYVPMTLGQCLLARVLLSRFVRSRQFQPDLRTIGALVARASLLAGLVPLASNLSFLLQGSFASFGDFSSGFGRWWLGDFLGIISVLPLPVIYLQARPDQTLGRVVRHIAPIAICFLGLILAYQLIEHREGRALQDRFTWQAEALSEQAQRELNGILSKVELLRLQFLHDRTFDRANYLEQVDRIVASHQGVHALNWIGLVRRADRAAVEAEMQRKHDPAFAFTRRLGDEIEPLPENFTDPFLLPILIAAPAEPNRVVWGMDLSVFARSAIEEAFAHGEPQLLPPIRIAQETGHQVGMVIYVPVEAGEWALLGEHPATGSTGLFNIVMRMDNFLTGATRGSDLHGLRLRLLDVTDPQSPVLLSHFEKGAFLTADQPAVTEEALLQHTTGWPVANRQWQLTIDGLPSYFVQYHSPTSFVVLGGGLLVCFLLGFFSLSNFLRTRVIEAAVETKTRELRIAKDEAERLARAKMEFLAIMSHEIRTPMNGMICTAEMLRESKLNDDQAELAEIIDLSAQTLLVLVNDILDFSKLEAGKAVLHAEPFDPQEIVRTVEATFRAKVREKAIRLSLVPARTAPSPLQLVGDRSRLLQVVMNLVSNAVKFTDHGEVRLRTHLEPQADGLVALRYEISDTGIGIPEDKVKELFEPFTQADASTTRRHGGTGLGLAISKRIVDLLEGEIAVASTPGRGSTFTVRVNLPVAKPPAAPGPGEVPPGSIHVAAKR